MGAPARFAYVDAQGGFHVAQASTQKRGPFTDLATGRLQRGEPLAVTIYDGDKAMTEAEWVHPAKKPFPLFWFLCRVRPSRIMPATSPSRAAAP